MQRVGPSKVACVNANFGAMAFSLTWLGASLSALVAIFVTPFDLPTQQRVLDVSWAVFAATGISGLACIFFAHKERGVHRDQASDVVAQMDLIEKRFDRAST